MDVGLRELVGAREGHFLLESGHHGPLWLELDALFLRPERVRPLADALADQLADLSFDVVCGPLVGGAFLAQELAGRLGAGFVYSERTAAPTPVDHRHPATRCHDMTVPGPPARGGPQAAVDLPRGRGAAARDRDHDVRAT